MNFALICFFAAFFLVVLASRQIGQYFSKVHLPLISGFLLTGILAGPYVLRLISLESLASLQVVDQISLAFIAFVAGSELHLQEFRSRLRSIKWIAVGLVFSIFILGTSALIMLAPYLPFMAQMTTASIVGISLLGGTILVAISPSSAVAVIKELRASGPFSRTALGVIVLLDVLVVVLFALNSSIADAFFSGASFNVGLILLLLLELLLALVLGVVVFGLFRLILKLHRSVLLKIILILAVGFGVFTLSGEIRVWSHHSLSAELLIEPLLICMIGSFLLVNYSSARQELVRVLHVAGPSVYIAFFTLTGASMGLDVLLKVWPVTLILFAVRVLGIFLGSFTGSWIAGELGKFRKLNWMSYITQAGVGLGLAKEVAVEFPEWGNSFATLIISVIVVNQLVGPIFFKIAISKMGEAHPKAKRKHFQGIRNAFIFGTDERPLLLGKQLFGHNWNVKLIGQEGSFLQKIVGPDDDLELLNEISKSALAQLNLKHAEAVVLMLADDENYSICELIYEHFGINKVVVLVNEQKNESRFRALGAMVVHATSALINLTEHLVRSPSGASILLGLEDEQEVIDLEVLSSDVCGMTLKELRLPLDVLVLAIHRDDKRMIVTGGHIFQKHDIVTIVGPFKTLDEVTLRFDS